MAGNSVQKSTVIFIILIAVFILIVIAFTFAMKGVLNKNPNALDGTKKLQDTYSITTGLTNLVDHPTNDLVKPIGYTIAYGTKYIFGVDFKGQGSDSEIVTLIAIWFIFFLILAEFIEMFGMMSKTTSKLVGALITIVMANLGALYGLLAGLMQGFAFLAGLSVIAALFSMIFAAFIAHFGINSFGQWMMNRKAMLEAAKMKAGGTATAGAIAGLRLAGQALKEAAP